MNIDFPASPTEGDIFAGGDKVWRYTSGVWKLIRYQPADQGTIDAGLPSDPNRVRINGGNQTSVFTSTSIDGGAV